MADISAPASAGMSRFLRFDGTVGFKEVCTVFVVLGGAIAGWVHLEDRVGRIEQTQQTDAADVKARLTDQTARLSRIEDLMMQRAAAR
jgi:hypothetical protein